MLKQEICELICAGFSGIWVESSESTSAVAEIKEMVASSSKKEVD